MNFSDPETNVKELSLKEGARVADFGAGSGAYVFALASAVGQSGRVFAIDVQQELLARISKDAERERIRNIEFVWADLETDGGSRLEAGSMDAVIISNILFQAEKKEVLIGEAGRVLRSGGELIIVVPRADGWLARLAGPHWFALDAPRHLYHFTPVTLGELLAKVGFRVREIRSFQPPEHLSFSWIYWAKRSRSMEGNPLVTSRVGQVGSRLLAGMVELLGAGDSMVVRASRSGP